MAAGHVDQGRQYAPYGGLPGSQLDQHLLYVWLVLGKYVLTLQFQCTKIEARLRLTGKGGSLLYLLPRQRRSEYVVNSQSSLAL